jgi:hypothetical protein
VVLLLFRSALLNTAALPTVRVLPPVKADLNLLTTSVAQSPAFLALAAHCRQAVTAGICGMGSTP